MLCARLFLSFFLWVLAGAEDAFNGPNSYFVKLECKIPDLIVVGTRLTFRATMYRNGELEKYATGSRPYLFNWTESTSHSSQEVYTDITTDTWTKTFYTPAWYNIRVEASDTQYFLMGRKVYGIAHVSFEVIKDTVNGELVIAQNGVTNNTFFSTLKPILLSFQMRSDDSKYFSKRARLIKTFWYANCGLLKESSGDVKLKVKNEGPYEIEAITVAYLNDTRNSTKSPYNCINKSIEHEYMTGYGYFKRHIIVKNPPKKVATGALKRENKQDRVIFFANQH